MKSIAFFLQGVACIILSCCRVGNPFFFPSPNQRRVHHQRPITTQKWQALNHNNEGIGSNGEERRLLPRLEDLPGPEDTTEDKIRSLSVLYNYALATGNPKLVVKRYAKDAVLIPDANSEPLMDTQAIERYYETYLPQQPHKRIVSGRVRVGLGWAEDVGVCEISTSNQPSVKAPYSIVYVWEDKRWKILHHHTSSTGPVERLEEAVTESQRQPSAGAPMTKERVQNLFQLFRDSLEVGDADVVARRFTGGAVYFPVDVYAPHRHGYDQIKEYFQEFLLNRPSISRVERALISIDPTSEEPKWAKDTGILQVTFETDGSTLDARYAIDYVQDASGMWKISHFSMSPLPKDWKQLRTLRSTPVPKPPRTSSASTSTSGRSYCSRDDYSPDSTSTIPAKESIEQKSPSPATEEEVRSWFEEWNSSMATGDAEAVVDLYAPEAVMFTSASASPKTTTEEIENFYEIFLLNRPEVKVIQYFVTTSEHWCKDAGVLEYTLSGSKRKIRERYLFLYSYTETGGWKIVHHSSSPVPGDLREDGPQLPANSASSMFFQ